MQTRSQVVVLFHSAAEAVIPLVELAETRSPADPWEAEPLFQRLRDRLSTLPISKVTFALLNAMARDAEDMIERGKFGGARWQLLQTRRRLLRYERDWEREDDPKSRKALRNAPSRNSVEANH